MKEFTVFWRIDIESADSAVDAARKAAAVLLRFDPTDSEGANVLEVCVAGGGAEKALNRASSGATSIDLGNWKE